MVQFAGVRVNGRDFFAFPLAGATSVAGAATSGDKRATAHHIRSTADLRLVNFLTGVRSKVERRAYLALEHDLISPKGLRSRFLAAD